MTAFASTDVETARPRSQCAVRWLTALTVVGALLVSLPDVGAQPDDADTGAPRSETGERDAEPPSEKPGVRYLEGPDGRAVPVPKGATLEEYLDYVKRRETGRENTRPYYISSLTIDGSSDGERVRLAVTVDIHVDSEDENVAIPLKMQEGVLVAHDYEGDGHATFGRLDKDDGYRWWFSGKGRHQLQLTMLVPIQREPPDRRVQLTLPTSAVSHLKLRVLDEQAVAGVPKTASLKTHSRGAEGTEFEVWGLRKLLDVSWKALPDPARVELQVNTAIALECTPDSLVLKALQSVRALQGSFDEIDVRLPSGFELVSVDGDEVQSTNVDPQDKNRVTVALAEPSTGPIELEWTLQRALTSSRDRVILEGFEVDRARSQSGYVAIENTESFQIARDPQESSSRFTHRVGIGEVSALRSIRTVVGTNDISTAYRFVTQPFRLVLDVSEVTPYFTVVPQYAVRFSETEAELAASLQVSVYRGALQGLELPWPRYGDEGWTVDPVQSPGLVELRTAEDSERVEALVVRFAERKTGTFEFKLNARRKIDSGAEPFSMSLPQIIATNQSAPTLLLRGAENVEVSVHPGDATSLQPLASPRPETELLQGTPVTAYTISSNGRNLLVEVIPHEQEVHTDTTLELTIEEQRVLVRQRIRYRVAYERLTQAKFVIPSELEDGITFSAQELPAPTGLSTSSGKQYRFVLDPPRIGEFEMIATYERTLSQESGAKRLQPLEIPLVTSSDGTYETTRLVVLSNTHARAVPADGDWKIQPSDDQSVQWVTATSKSKVVLEFAEPSDADPGSFAVDRVLAQLSVDQSGRGAGRVHFAIVGQPVSLLLQIPEAVEPDRCWWDGRELAPERTSRNGPDNSHYRIGTPNGESGMHVLTVEFHSTHRHPLDWSDALGLHIPHFRSDVWARNVVWEIELPPSQYLFNHSKDVSPGFAWIRNRLFWSRAPQNEFDDLAEWLGDPKAADLLLEHSGGNRYLLRSVGLSPVLRLRTMSHSTIMLLGAGAALAVGFLLLKVPATRNALWALVFSFAIALVSLVYAEPVRLLIQPACLGLLMAIGAVVIDRILQRRKRAGVLTLSTPSDYVAPPSSIERVSPAAVGSEDVTAVRAPTPDERLSEPVSSSDSTRGQS